MIRLAAQVAGVCASEQMMHNQSRASDNKTSESACHVLVAGCVVARKDVYQSDDWVDMLFVFAQWPRATMSGRGHVGGTEIRMEDVVTLALTLFLDHVSTLAAQYPCIQSAL